MTRLTFSLLAVSVGIAVYASRGESTPVVVVTPDTTVPTPSECRVEARQFSELAQLIGTPGPGDTGRVVSVPTSLPIGRPADPSTILKVSAVVREWMACANAGDSLRLFALYTDDLLRSMGSLPASTLESLATPEPPSQWIYLLSLPEVRLLEDGRIGAIVVIGNLSDSDTMPGKAVFFVFARSDGRLLIDETIEDLYVDGEVIDLGTALGTPAG